MPQLCVQTEGNNIFKVAILIILKNIEFHVKCEQYKMNPWKECRLQRHYQKVARPILSGMGRRNTRSIKFSIPVLDGSLGNAIQLIVRHSESSVYQCSKKWNVRDVLFCNLKTCDSRKRHWAMYGALLKRLSGIPNARQQCDSFWRELICNDFSTCC